MLVKKIKIVLVVLVSLSSLIVGRDIKINESAQIAQNYKTYKKLDFPEWNDTNISKIHPFYSVNGTLLAYEAEIVSGSEKMGYIFVNVLNEGAVIPLFSTKGKSISSIISSYFKEEVQPKVKESGIQILDKKFLISYPFGYAIGVKFNKSATFLKDISQQDGWYIFTPFFQSANLDYRYKKLKSKKVLKGEREKYRQELLNGNFNSKFFTLKQNGSTKSIKTRSHSRSNYINGTFSSYYQEKLRWNGVRNKVYAGCTPVAWAIALEYLDRHGFPWLVGTKDDNKNFSTSDPDTRYAIGQLRHYLGTTGGNTFTKNLAKGKYYAHKRGYKSFNSKNYHNKKWSTIINSINANQPIITSYFTKNGESGHSAVCYKYIDEYSKNDDKFCIRTGWKDPVRLCVDRSYLSVVTTLEIKNYYGAFVISKKGYAYTKNHENVISAEVNALLKCRKKFKGCSVVKTIKNQCFAFANKIGTSHGYFLAGHSDNIKKRVLKSCNKKYNNCELKVFFCSKGNL